MVPYRIDIFNVLRFSFAGRNSFIQLFNKAVEMKGQIICGY